MPIQAPTIVPSQCNIMVDKNNKTVVDVVDCKDFVDQEIEVCNVQKQAVASWDHEKKALRSIAEEVFAFTEAIDQPATKINLLGSDNKVIEVAASEQRKELPDKLVKELSSLGYPQLVVDEVEVTLKGDLAKWLLALPAIASRVGVDVNISVKERKVLSPEFEAVRRITRRKMTNTLLDEKLRAATTAGIFAPAVEAKLLK